MNGEADRRNPAGESVLGRRAPVQDPQGARRGARGGGAFWE